MPYFRCVASDTITTLLWYNAEFDLILTNHYCGLSLYVVVQHCHSPVPNHAPLLYCVYTDHY